MFENLAVYQKAVDFAEQAITLTESFSRGYFFWPINPTERPFRSQPIWQKVTVDSPNQIAAISSSSREAQQRIVFLYLNWRAERVCSRKHRTNRFASKSRSSPK